jgi:amidase
MNRRHFLGSSTLGALAAASTAHFDLSEVTIGDLNRRMKSGRDSAVSLTRKYLSRIAEMDKYINAVIERNPDALRIAAALDAERKSKGPRGPLHGVPVLIKDNIDTADKMSTTAGSLALEGSIALHDAFIVQRLRAAGAVILGKTNLSEWANYRSSHSVSGWSGRGGQTHNPYALDRNPCGSSSGSGAGVAANLCAVAIGTETDGSVVCPASMNGVVGIKPTLGLLSRSGIIPIAHSQDTAGPMARTVRDAAILLSALTGADPRDPATHDSEGHAQKDYTTSLDPKALRGARLGVARKFMGNNTKVDRLIEDAMALMKQQGAEIIDLTDATSSDHEMGEAEGIVLSYEFKTDVNAYLANLGPKARMKNLDDLIAFNLKNADREMPWFGQETFFKAQKCGPLSDQVYLDALAKSKALSRDQGIDALLTKHRLDAIIAPTAGPAWVTDWVNGDFDTGGCSSPAAIAGYPPITVPAGYVEGLPIGLSFFGTAWTEPKLIALAYAYEQTSKMRREPKFLPTVQFTSPHLHT